DRIISGVVLTDRNEAIPGASITAVSAAGMTQTVSDGIGKFRLRVPNGAVILRVSGKYLVSQERRLGASEASEGLMLQAEYTIPPVHEDLVISATALNPTIDQRNDIQQNQGTQGHGQGYLGALKALTPELIDDVDILNGPFSAEYGDFSGLGVVHIRLKESLPNLLTVRAQGGSFNAYRGLVIYSPALNKANAFIAYDGSHTDGPFINPGRYKRHIITGNYTRHLNEKESLGFKLNFGTNDFFSSGQIPLDLVASGQLNRFGFIDPFDGGRVKLGTFATYYKRDFASGDILKVDGFLGRSLFDL
ncbi:MAG: carboxypeptidase regulatory-like domain-containing protein, partial [Terriglobales bacterium]